MRLLKRPRKVEHLASNNRIMRPDYFGSAKPEVVFVVDPIVGRAEEDEAPKAKAPVFPKLLDFLTDVCKRNGIDMKKAAIVSSAPPVTAEQWDSQSRLSAHIKSNREKFVENIRAAKPKLIIAMGKSGASQVLNRSAQITKVRGSPQVNEEFDCLVFPTLGLAHVIRIPENQRSFEADFATIKKIIDAKYQLDYQDDLKKDYRWVDDIQFLIDRVKQGRFDLSVDIEGVGLDWFRPETRILTVQITTAPGVAYAIPIDYNPKNHLRSADNVIRKKLIAQLKELLEHPNAFCFGQNFKFDYMMMKHKLNIIVKNYEDDTILLMHSVDENMLDKSLDEITRVYVPALAGYADEFNRDPIHQGKSRMDLVPPDKMLMYGCGDTDATWRAKHALEEELRKDPKAYNCYRRVMMEGIRAFAMIEDHGFCIDKVALKNFEISLRIHQEKEYKRIWRMIPATIRANYLEPFGKRDRDGRVTKRPSLTRPDFLRQMLFYHKQGIQLKPRVFTKSTAKLKDHSARVPSTSGKHHLAYFKDDHPFISAIMEYIKNEKLLGTYVGTEDDETIKGFYKYIFDGRIRPNYLLHRTVTGRTASANPNGQNFPKRGALAKEYRKIFTAPPGYVLLEVDFSQIELRIAAIMANEPTMLRLYREGKDIHAATAAAVMGISMEEFDELPPETRDLQRFRAKAVNFGFLYGMGWRKFVTYAKTDYGIDYTDEEAQNIRNAFFALYKNLLPWHRKVTAFVKEHGFVRSFDGRVRHLQSVFSPDEAIASGAIRQAVNSPVQAFGSDLGLMALALLVKNVAFDLVRPIGFIHDALVAIAPAHKAKEAAAAIKYWMEHVPLEEYFKFKPPIPIVAEASVGLNLSSMTEIKDSWYKDDNVSSYHSILVADYEAKLAKWPNQCKQARLAGKDEPPRPVRPLRQQTKLVQRPRARTIKPLPVKPRPLAVKRRA